MECEVVETEYGDFPYSEEKIKQIENVTGENESDEWIAKYIGTDLTYKHKICWKMTIPILIIHLVGLCGLNQVFKGEVRNNTLLWSLFVAVVGTVGVSVGAHRYYSHKSFRATPILEIILLILQTAAGQFTVYSWCKDHRQHHRYSDTDADPHNTKRGLFFCYVGWILTHRNKYVKELGRRTCMSDLRSNKFVMFQKRHYYPLFLLFGVIIPVWVPVHFFGETWTQSLLVAYFLRHALHLNYAWAVVVLSHNFGVRPYDKNIQPVDSWPLTIISGGDGNHNYHHVFPWDYKTAENHNFMSCIIWICKILGLAYDLKSAPTQLIHSKVQEKGDGTHFKLGTEEGMSKVTAIGPLHPLNPTYRSVKDPDIVTRIIGPKNPYSL